MALSRIAVVVVRAASVGENRRIVQVKSGATVWVCVGVFVDTIRGTRLHSFYYIF